MSSNDFLAAQQFGTVLFAPANKNQGSSTMLAASIDGNARASRRSQIDKAQRTRNHDVMPVSEPIGSARKILAELTNLKRRSQCGKNDLR
jgi:hypothetical protein